MSDDELLQEMARDIDWLLSTHRRRSSEDAKEVLYTVFKGLVELAREGRK